MRSEPAASATRLPPLPYEDWEPTKTSLHLLAQIVGKVRLALTPPRNHWWHVTLYVTPHGLTTGPIPSPGGDFTIDFDFVQGAARVWNERGFERALPLRGASVASFYRELMATLRDAGAEVAIRAEPYDLAIKTPFAEDDEHAVHDLDAARRFAHVLAWSHDVFWRFNSPFVGKISPIHFFWHAFDLAVTRFSGRAAPARPGANRVEREAYSHEVISFGFWPGDDRMREPAFYSYAAPEPAGMKDEPLAPAEATWSDQWGNSLAVYRYDDLRRAADPELALLAFLQSAYDAGARRASWDAALLRRDA